MSNVFDIPCWRKIASNAVFWITLVAFALAAYAENASVATEKHPPANATTSATHGGVAPFGANLFQGNFAKMREDGLDPDYIVMPGDQVAVNIWGAVEVNEVFVVDSQGNIFLPEVGPVRLAGVKNAKLTDAVRKQIHRVYTSHFNVYTNLLRATPVGVYVTGAVVHPGRYAGIPSDSVLVFLDQAGGIDSQLGSYRDIAIIRDGKEIGHIDLYDFLLKGTLNSPQLKDGDAILVKKRGPVVVVQGNVAKPAQLELSGGKMVGADALAIVPNAKQATEVTIFGMREGVPFNQTMALSAFSSATLEDGDTITLLGEGQPATILVTLQGEFEGPSVLAVKRGSRLVDVLNHIPVNAMLSNPRGVHLMRPSVAEEQKKSIEDSLARLERTTMLALSDSQGEASIRVKEAELVNSFVARAKQVHPLGRVVTVQDGRQMNVLLRDGDIIMIPKRTNVVQISGEVMVSQAVVYKPGFTAEDYVDQAGGYSQRADKGKVIVMRANAAVEIGDTDAPVRPGDRILVPPRVDSKFIQIGMDIIQILYQIAVSAGVVLSI